MPNNYYGMQIGRNSKKKQINIQTINKKGRKLIRKFIWKPNQKISKKHK